MIVSIRKPSVYETDTYVKQGTLLISKETDHGLTEGRIYVATKNQGSGTFHECIFVINDEGKEIDYTGEFFALYEGERVIVED